MKKMFTMLVAIVMVATTVFAERVSETDAALVANNFMNVKSSAVGAKKAPVKKMVIKKAPAQQENQFYVYENENGEGWVMVSASDKITPILAFSETGHFRTDNMPQNLSNWLGKYNKFVQKVESDGVEASAETTAQWEQIKRGAVRATQATVVVGPLVKTIWDQDKPYYNLCPGSGTTKAYTGCVATAMAQVMNYWQWPIQGTGSHSYQPLDPNSKTGAKSKRYGTQSADFSATTYDWDNMLNSYSGSYTTAQATAVATLMYHCGVATEMMYGNDADGGSGTVTGNYGDEEYHACAQNALWMNFGYKKESIKSYMRDGYTYSGVTYYQKWSDADWTAMVKAELDLQHPIMYGGASSAEEGHSFICDGYRSDDYFHFNWGWSGENDGYYKLSSLKPGGGGAGGGSYDFSEDQDVIIGIVPDKPLNENETTLKYDLSGVEMLTGAAAGTINKNEALTATFKAKDAYYPLANDGKTTVSVTVGGTAGNYASYASGVLTISIPAASVTDAVVIKVAATRDPSKVVDCDRYEYTYTASVGSGNQTLGDKSWTITLADGKVQQFDKDRGEHFGSQSTPAKEVTYTTSDFDECLISNLSIEAAGTKATLEAFIDGTSLGSKSITASNAAYTFTNDKGLQGELKFLLTSSEKALYVKSIAINTTNDDDEQGGGEQGGGEQGGGEQGGDDDNPISGDVYQKVTTAPSNWAGTYLIVYEDGNVAFNGGLNKLDAANDVISVSISNSQIGVTDATNAAEFTITKSGEGYAVKSKSGIYIGKSNNANGMDESQTELVNTISMTDGEVLIASAGKAVLRFNSASNQNRFRYYKSDTYTNQKPIALYKKAGNVGTSIDEIDYSLEQIEAVYNLLGQRVDNDLRTLQAGVYVIKTNMRTYKVLVNK